MLKLSSDIHEQGEVHKRKITILLQLVAFIEKQANNSFILAYTWNFFATRKIYSGKNIIFVFILK